MNIIREEYLYDNEVFIQQYLLQRAGIEPEMHNAKIIQLVHDADKVFQYIDDYMEKKYTQENPE